MTALPPAFAAWFAERGWQPHPHQLALLGAGGDRLLIAPTGGGKTLAGFLPSLVELAAGWEGLHTLYVSPLKALAADIRRNLTVPVTELGLPVRIEDRTADTPGRQKARQRVDPPQILLTTPESLALLLSFPEAGRMFAGLRRVVLDEIHALAENKRGDQLMLALARLRRLAPGVRVTGLSATVENPGRLAAFMGAGGVPVPVIAADPGPAPDIAMLPTRAAPPWAGAGGRFAVRDVLDLIAAHRTTLVFINTRAQAELFFQALWAANDEGLPIGLHHGSLGREARARVEAAMAAGALRGVVCTGSLDLGIDWGSVDLVVQVGAPKNVKRLVQRIGRANHRYNAPSKARIVPANRFEVVECLAALQAVAEHDLDGEPRPEAPLDVLCQHLLLIACAGPFEAEALFDEVRGAGPYAGLGRTDFDACLDFVATGGYALRAYDRWQQLVERDGRWALRDPRRARDIRLHVGTIVEPAMLRVAARGRDLGEVEEAFVATLSPGDTFLIGGQTVRYDKLKEAVVQVTPQPAREPKIAVFSGLKLAMSTLLARRVQGLLADPAGWAALPGHTADWLALQARISALPAPGVLLVETFARGGRWYLALYGFAGRNAMQTLGLLLGKRMEAAGLEPLGFVATDYALLAWSLQPVTDPAPLLDARRLREGFEAWLGETMVMKRTFRAVAVVAGLIRPNLPGAKASGKQATFSTDILYDTLRRWDPGHLLMRITRDEAARGLVDFGRIEAMLADNPQIVHMRAPHVTPLAAPLLLEAGRVPVGSAGHERLLEEEAARLMAEAGLDTGANVV
jgi:ATP-dependent helicase Lhr and Lhr-like helicase